MTGTEEFALSIELSTREAAPLSEVALSDIGIKERADLQRWVEAYSEMIGPDLLLITTEFDRWELRQQKVADRLDVLCIDSDGRLLVAELKRGEAVDTTELQALKYAAYCSTLTTAEVVEEYSRYQNVSHEDAREARPCAGSSRRGTGIRPHPTTGRPIRSSGYERGPVARRARPRHWVRRTSGPSALRNPRRSHDPPDPAASRGKGLPGAPAAARDTRRRKEGGVWEAP